MKDTDVMKDVAEVTVPSDLQTSVSYQIRLLQIASYKTFEQQISSFGSAPRYFGMLRIIEANPGIPQTRLAEAIFLDRSSLVPILDTLSREGWIERRKTDQDKRLRCIFLTARGQEQLALLKQEVDAHERRVSAALSKDDKSTLLKLLAQLDGTLREMSKP